MLLAALLCSLALPFTAFASSAEREGSPSRFVDEVGVLTQSEADRLTARLDTVSERHSFDTVVAVVYSLEGRDARRFAADFYERNGYGFGRDLDGAILLISMQRRDFAFVTTGYGLVAFTNAGQEYLERQFLPHLQSDDFYEAFMVYANAVDDFVTRAAAGEPYNRGNIPTYTASERNTLRLQAAVVSIVVALIIPGIVVGVWTSQLKSVRKQDLAHAYVRPGSFSLTAQHDIFLFRRVSKTRRQTNTGSGGGSSGSFRSSSGGSFSGRSGRF